MTFKELHDRIKRMTSEWYLRMESDSFLILVNKKSNEYVNIYEDQFPKGMLSILADTMEKHPNIK